MSLMDGVSYAGNSDPAMILIYGEAGVGKTTAAASFPNPVFILTEEAKGGFRLPAVNNGKPISNLNQLDQWLGALMLDEHEFETVVVDSITGLDPILRADVARENQWFGKDGSPSVEAAGFGKGWEKVDDEWVQTLKRLKGLAVRRSMNVVLIGHAEVKSYTPPGGEAYDIFRLACHKRVRPQLEALPDCVTFLRKKVVVREADSGNRKIASGGRMREACFDGEAAYFAKKLTGMPDQLFVQEGEFFHKVKDFLPNYTGATPVETVAAE
ncbi:MAG: ATP-binding protein [Pseudomonadota bacterium]